MGTPVSHLTMLQNLLKVHVLYSPMVQHVLKVQH